MVKAGKGTDATIDTLLPPLEEGDIVVDGGNAYFEDTDDAKLGFANSASTSWEPASPAVKSGLSHESPCPRCSQRSETPWVSRLDRPVRVAGRPVRLFWFRTRRSAGGRGPPLRGVQQR